ncbi:DUF2971 domain-containing protein [Aliarcobacter cryaerophilus]|uniref:DUF2971 domain-containing protein n=1 Tax=Aliarcobacter cryaerophilus TaxID=28198 RepID=UPI0021B52627|nr:DUF2971 domain-containing protein [Aliarcobacter cryaerophilus]MCT7473457.1 DUF2971 domain-containing protein [Aliarcobacter cryaerophilus]
MKTQKESNILNISDLDQKIYRIISITRFKELIKNRELVLVNPEKWDDPFENFFLKGNAVDNNGNNVDFSNLREMWYGQCWTKNKDTDAMWRIYSHNKDGIRISTTIRKLFDAIYDSSDKYAPLKYFIGEVEYKTLNELNNFGNENSFWSIAIGGQNDGFAKLLCIKREAFSHENEIRILVNENNEEEVVKNKGLFKININPSTLIDDLCLDPRLNDEEYNKYKIQIEKISKLPIFQSDLYKFNLAPIDME